MLRPRQRRSKRPLALVGYRYCNVNPNPTRIGRPPRLLPRLRLAAPLLLVLLLCRMLLLTVAATRLAPRSLGFVPARRRLLGLQRRRSLMASAAPAAAAGGKPRVIVVTGPTAVGKSSLALTLCRELQGEIISVDSVQVYRRLDIGSNKPSREERAAVRHHLLDVLDADAEEAFTAGDFVRQAEAAIDDVLARGRVPVVVGGTSMYTQWLVQGRPDAPRSDPNVEAEVRGMLAPFQAQGDWEGALALLAQRHPQRAAKLSPNDWYRLERSLEVSLMTAGDGADDKGEEEGAEVFTGARRAVGAGKYDFRCFFLIAPREALCHVIDQRCAEMVERGLLEETADLLASGTLNPASPPGRAIGYRQAIEYLQRADVGDAAAEAGALKTFLEDFATATRRYAKQQMVWYRAQLEFMWVRWDLHDPAPAQALVRACYDEAPTTHSERRAGPEQAALREENLQEGKKMKRYVSSVLADMHGDRFEGLARRAWACRQRLQEAVARKASA